MEKRKSRVGFTVITSNSSHKKLIKDYGLDFDGVKCTMYIRNNYCSPCIAQSMLILEGYIAGCIEELK
jgi:hypothetical protein